MKRTALAILLALTCTPRIGIADEFAVPPPTLVERMRHELDRSEWLRVATPNANFDVHARTVGPEGLGGITRRHRLEPIPDPIAWRSIERIDVVHSRFRSRQITWGIMGASLGGFGEMWAKQDANRKVSLWGLALGAAAGGWIGGKLGERNERMELVYVARLAPSQPVAAGTPPPTADATGSTQATGTPPSTSPLRGETAAPPMEPAQSPELRGDDKADVQRACAEIRPSSLLRIQGDFGRFVGKAQRAEPGGLVGLWSASDAAPPGDPLTWDHIYSMDRRVHSTRQGAIVGGAVIGSVGLLAGMVGAAVAAAGNSDTSPGVVFYGLTLGGIAIGAVSGAVFGAAVPRWKQVYERRAPAPAEAPRH